MKELITLTDDSGTAHTFSGNTVLVFIDETGNELFKDKEYPLFGLGGCLCLVKDYYKQINIPWKHVENAFDKSDLPLHASSLQKNKMTQAQYSAINNFLTANAFGRFACILTHRIVNSSPYTYFDIAIAGLHQRIRSIMQWLPLDNVVMIIESSERTNIKTTAHFDPYKLEANGRQIPLHHFFMNKKQNEPGLIVADFIIHTAGSTVFSKHKNNIENYLDRRDFKNVFGSVDEKLVSFIEVNTVIPS